MTACICYKAGKIPMQVLILRCFLVHMCILAEKAGKIKGKLNKLNILKKVVGEKRIFGSDFV